MINKKVFAWRVTWHSRWRNDFFPFYHLPYVILTLIYCTDCIYDCRLNKHPIVDKLGKIKFESGSRWSEFNAVVQYAVFCKKYAYALIGQRKLQEYYKTHSGKGLFHNLHYSDEVCICLIMRNNQGMWVHQVRDQKAKEQNSSSPQKANTKKRKRSRGNSKNQGMDKVSDTLLDATISPRWLLTGFKTGSKIAYLASGWSKEGE